MKCDICGSDKANLMIDGIYRCDSCQDDYDSDYFLDGLYDDPREEAWTIQERNPNFRSW